MCLKRSEYRKYSIRARCHMWIENKLMVEVGPEGDTASGSVMMEWRLPNILQHDLTA